MAIAPKATWESPSPMKEKRFSTRITPKSAELKAIMTATKNAYRTKGNEKYSAITSNMLSP